MRELGRRFFKAFLGAVQLTGFGCLSGTHGCWKLVLSSPRGSPEVRMFYVNSEVGVWGGRDS